LLNILRICTTYLTIMSISVDIRSAFLCDLVSLKLPQYPEKYREMYTTKSTTYPFCH